MHGRTRVLIIDDEYKTLEILGMRLSQDGFEVTTATSGEAGLKLAYEKHPDAILLDVIMPGMDGFKTCRRLREVTDAVIMLVSVKGDSDDVIRGLHSGADDYIVKPYNYLELLARLYACLRRRSDSKLPPLRLQRGEAVLITDPSRRLVFVNDGRSVQLTPKEFELLRYLVKNKGRVLSADAILSNVWGLEYKGERDLVKQFIYRLRNKLEVEPSEPEYIVTVRGSGYAFEEDTRPRGLKKAVQTPRHQAEVPPPPQSVKPFIIPERQEPPSWAAQTLPRESVSPGLHSSDKNAQPLARKDRRAWVRHTAVTLFFVFLIPLGTAFASRNTLPGDALYSVKTLVEDIQYAAALDEVNRAQLHLEFAEKRLEEVTSLMNQRRYEDIPAGLYGFESEMREATWVLVGISGDEERKKWALEAFLGESLENNTEALDQLMKRAPNKSGPVIDHAIAVLEAESSIWRAFLMVGSPSTTMEGMVDRCSSDVDTDSPRENTARRELPVDTVLSDDEHGSQLHMTSVAPTATARESTPSVFPTRYSFTQIVSTLRAIPITITTSRAVPTRTPTPTNTSYAPRP
jgi:two-component system alkaline phosphatase synthesis response regulator PhoP